jgi:outer membrane protein assembly factor BamE (lipoprotein component of BamABCDE complex)
LFQEVFSKWYIAHINYLKEFIMRTQPFAISVAVLSLVLSASANADVIKLPDRAPQVISLENSPTRGMTKQQVEAQFGSPSLKVGPTGNPPIYRWDYAAYSVFFENNHVLHSVVLSDQ